MVGHEDGQPGRSGRELHQCLRAVEALRVEMRDALAAQDALRERTLGDVRAALNAASTTLADLTEVVRGKYGQPSLTADMLDISSRVEALEQQSEQQRTSHGGLRRDVFAALVGAALAGLGWLLKKILERPSS